MEAPEFLLQEPRLFSALVQFSLQPVWVCGDVLNVADYSTLVMKLQSQSHLCYECEVTGSRQMVNDICFNSYLVTISFSDDAA